MLDCVSTAGLKVRRNEIKKPPDDPGAGGIREDIKTFFIMAVPSHCFCRFYNTQHSFCTAYFAVQLAQPCLRSLHVLFFDVAGRKWHTILYYLFLIKTRFVPAYRFH